MSQILVELIKLANLIITITKAVACGGPDPESCLDIRPRAPEKPWTAKGVRRCAGRFPERLPCDIAGAGEESLDGHQLSGLPGGRPWASSAAPAPANRTPGQPDSPVLRRHRRTGAGRRRGRARLGPRRTSAAAHRRGAPEGGAVRRHASGKICSWGNARRHRRGAAGRRWRPPRRGMWSTASKGGLDASIEQGGRQPFRRPATAADHCPGAGAAAGNPDSGRQRLGPGLRHRRARCAGRPIREMPAPRPCSSSPSEPPPSGTRTRSWCWTTAQLAGIGTHARAAAKTARSTGKSMSPSSPKGGCGMNGKRNRRRELSRRDSAPGMKPLSAACW